MGSSRWSLAVRFMLAVAMVVAVSCGGTAAPSPSPTAAGGAAAASPTATPRQTLNLKMAVPVKSLNFLVFYFGQEKGLYTAEGINLDIQVINPVAANAALLSGEINFTGAGASAMIAALQGSPLRGVAWIIGRPTGFIYAKKDITTLDKSFKGKSIALDSIVGGPAVVVNTILKAKDLDPTKDVNIVATGTTQNAYSALIGGSVDAALLTPPFSAMADNAGYKMVARTSDFAKGTQGQLATSVAYIQSNPDAVKRMIRGTLKSVAYTLDHADEAIAFVGTTFNLDAATAKATYQQIADGLIRNGLPDKAAMQGDLSGTATLADVEKVIDLTLLNEVNAGK